MEESNLNNTNVINTQNLVFSEDYIRENLELVSSFLKVIVLKNKVTSASIKELEILSISLPLLKEIESIVSLKIEEDRNLTYVMAEELMNLPYLETINCYYMPEFLFERLTIYYHKTVELRNELFFLSDFMEINKLDTYSKIYYKKRIVLPDLLTESDKTDLKDFMLINNHLKRIEIFNYKKEDFLYLLEILPKRLENVKIVIFQNEMNSDLLLKEIEFFRKMEKKYLVTIHIEYSKKYKEKNLLKQINLQFLKFFFIFIALVGLIYFLVYKHEEKEERNRAESMKEEIMEIKEKFEEIEPNDSISEEEESENLEPPRYTRVLSELQKMNPDTVGWLTVKNTNIDYPVVQSTDNEYYLEHSFDNQSSSFGWIFVDYRNNMEKLSRNTIIYGHNVRGTNLLFGSLKNVLEPSWYQKEENQTIDFETTNGKYEWEIFSIYTTPKTSDYLITAFPSNEDFLSYVEREKERSIYDFSTVVKEDDKILTLSTCYKDSDHRLVVHAKLVQ